jgi:3-hydroxy-9,10-secoandrosta-1,3,5(10)-triene-9,17-dione monooxygenase
LTDVLSDIEKLAEYLSESAADTEQLGRLPDETVRRLKQVGIIRMLQPAEFGGFESHPVDFFQAVMATAAACAASGWVCGIVGVHPWELALADPKVQEEIWGEDPDTWVSSPYAPFGRARPVDGGYIFSGRWPFSSGTDHCDWAFLGGFVTDADGEVGQPPVTLHFLLPRRDYRILDGTWEVMGLKGTGSKDVEVHEAFVPSHRTVDFVKLRDGLLPGEMGRDEPLYQMPFAAMFCTAVSAATIGICEGALAAATAYQRDRISGLGTRVSDDPHVFAGLAVAAADIDASRVHLLNGVAEMYDVVASGASPSMDLRVRVRRNQVTAAQRAVNAVDSIFTKTGGGALRLDQPFQRFWRDAHAAMNHACNASGQVYEAYSSHIFGRPLPPTAIL